MNNETKVLILFFIGLIFVVLANNVYGQEANSNNSFTMASTNYSLATTHLAVELQQAKTFEEAHEIIKEMANRLIAHPDEEAQLFFDLGLKAGKDAEWRSALRLYTIAIEKGPQYWEAYNRRSIAYFNLGAFQLALTDLELVTKHVPHHWAAWFGKSLVLHYMSKPQQALQALEQAKDFNPFLKSYAEIEAIYKQAAPE